MQSTLSIVRGENGARITAAAAGLLVVALIAWFAWPVTGAQMNEGFQSTIILNARALLAGDTSGIDPLYRLDNDFFLVSRLGLSLAVAPLLQLGLSPLFCVRLIMFVSLAGLVMANTVLLVRAYGVPPVLALLPSLLLPGLFESAWFLNDNVLSAALSSTALVVFWTGRSLPMTALAALLWGAAILCRTDAVLLAPAFAILLCSELPDWPARIRHAVVAGLIAAAVPFLVYAAAGLAFLDVFPLTARATLAWDRKDKLTHMLHPVLKGFSFPGLLATGAGAVAVLLGRRWREVGLCLVVPLIYAAAYGRMLTEVRYLLPLTPFFGILMVLGARAVAGAAPRVRTAAVGCMAAAVALCFAPPLLLPPHQLYFLSTDNDMIRPSIGRIWSPLLGDWWNRKLGTGSYVARNALASASAQHAADGNGGPGIVVSTRWTPDRMVDLHLTELGFTGRRAPEPPACREIAELFTRGNERILHVRAHIPMLPTERSATTWRRLVNPCLDALGVGGDARLLVVGQMLLTEPPPPLTEPAVRVLYAPVTDVVPWAQAIASKSYVPFVAVAPREAVPRFLVEPKDERDRVAAEAAIGRRAILQ